MAVECRTGWLGRRARPVSTTVRPQTAKRRGLPAEVQFSEKAHTVLSGWPGASPDELVNNLLAVLTKRAAEEADPDRKRRLEGLAESVRAVGVSTVSQVLSKVLLGEL